jgi:hypothetical protein
VKLMRVVSDGRAPHFMKNDTTYHTNKLRWIITHPPNNTLPIQLYCETFR